METRTTSRPPRTGLLDFCIIVFALVAGECQYGG
jgi:hypothetical protein